jgi:putative glutamine amidotransferase
MTFQSVTPSFLQNALSLVTPNLKLADILSSQGYNTEISNIHIHMNESQTIDFSGCNFNGVTFSGNFKQSTFEYVKFNDVSFQHADFSSTTFNHVSISNSNFSQSNIKDASFIQSEISSSSAWDCDFTNAAFVNSSIQNSLFGKSTFENVLNETNSIENMHIICNQNDNTTAPFDTAQHHCCQPTIALVGDLEWFSTPHAIIMDYTDGTPVTINEYAPYNISESLLESEINYAINDILSNGLHEPSIAQQILKSDQPMINAIKDIAYQAIENVDAIWIPGGPDIHPEFYGEANTAAWWVSDSFYREILEFALTDAALSMNKTIFGVCHGSQLVNVYLGGTLYQDVPGQLGICPLLNIETHEGLLGSVIDGPIIGPSFHHQAVKDVAPSLEVVATYEGVIKATQSNDGSKIMLTQFHPEYEIDDNSINILKQFFSVSSETKMLDKMIELSDVLHIDSSIDHLLEPQSISIDTNENTIKATVCYSNTCATPLPPLVTPETELAIMM